MFDVLSPLRGIQAVLYGLKKLRHPRLRMLGLLPIGINALVYAGILWFAVDWADDVVGVLASWLPTWLGFLTTLLFGLMIGVLLLLLGITFVSVALIVGSPFYTELCVRTLALLQSEAPRMRETGLRETMLSLPRGALREVSKLLSFLPMIVITLIISVIPVLNLAAPFLWTLLNSWILALQFLDYPFDETNQPFQAVKAWGSRHRGLALGFGFGVLLGGSVPLLNLLIVPAAVIGATKLWFEVEQGTDSI